MSTVRLVRPARASLLGSPAALSDLDAGIAQQPAGHRVAHAGAKTDVIEAEPGAIEIHHFLDGQARLALFRHGCAPAIGQTMAGAIHSPLPLRELDPEFQQPFPLWETAQAWPIPPATTTRAGLRR